MRQGRQFAVNWDHQIGSTPGSDLESFPISRFETNLKSRQQTKIPPEKEIICFILFSSKIRAAEEVGVALKIHVRVLHTPTRPFSRP